MTKSKFLFGLLVFCMYLILSCKKEEKLKPERQQLIPEVPVIPDNFPAFGDDVHNPLTKEGIALGRILFYDVRLSGNNKVSCASCHKQELAFSDGLNLSNEGVSGRKLERHAPTLFNLAWSENGLFWDGGATNLESQAFGPLTNEDEMNQNLTELEYELKQIPDYVKRFQAAFNGEVKPTSIVKALAQFQRTLVSGNSNYDKFIRHEGASTLSEAELLGLKLVNEKCRNCHAGELFTDNNFHNNGIDDNYPNQLEGIYQGRYRVSLNLNDIGKFKTPSLRNVMLTAPYMHDGRFKTIDEVLEHYSSGVKITSTLDPALLYRDKVPGITITQQEKMAIKAFLNVLTDENFITNKKFSNPN